LKKREYGEREYKKMTDIYNSTTLTEQNVYDSYNNLIFSADKRVFNKMVKKIELYNEVKHLSGDIMEFGVFKGAGIGIFLNLKGMNEPNSIMKVIGFDYFDPMALNESLNGLSKSMMTTVLNRVESEELSKESVESRLSKFNKSDYLLIKGDAVKNALQFNTENPGARIKMIYMDLDLGEPTYSILNILWSKIVKGGIIVFDEYAYHKWDESDGVDKFLKEIKGDYEFFDTKISSPTAYIKKTCM